MPAKYVRAAILGAICVTHLGACGGNPPPLDAAAARVAVLRHIIAHDTVATSMKLETRCAGFGKLGALVDPDRAALASLEKSAPAIRPASACAVDDKSGLVKDVPASRPAVLFYAELATCTAAQCKVSGGYQIGRLGAEGRTYIATPDRGGWKVRLDPSAPAWIS